ncbi:sigma-54 interaction domain-containing protein [Melioribacteraceae bacterium 4301-Me]|uniref:sigma-54 interaction domain-containing protein n=1 Tax=Pyranulibacter aquaticus TaxID=3163344 RepID=UPI003598C35A
MTVAEFQKKFGIIGRSQQIKDLVDIVMQVAQSDISVLITGESGVGKEVFARAIHGYSNRSDKQLVSVNCGAIPEGILESELFGHKKGAFTGAIDDRKGYFEIADGGTLFLDEIAEMPLTTQVKLLRVLETKEFMRIGSERVTKVDVRIIAATNKDLQREVDAKRFRSDLYFRLKAVTLNIPPLRSRPEDILELVNFFAKNYTENNRIPEPKITEDAVDALLNYSWPGNIRELKNVIETAIALSKSGIINSEMIIPLLSTTSITEELRNLPVHLNRSPEALDREMIYRALIEIKKDLMELKNYATKNSSEFYSPNTNISEVVPMDELEKQAILNALNFTKHNKRKAAKLLKISERTLYRKLKEYGIE